jgi:hypothetical protein
MKKLQPYDLPRRVGPRGRSGVCPKVVTGRGQDALLVRWHAEDLKKKFCKVASRDTAADWYLSLP